MTIDPDVAALIDAKIKRRCSLPSQIAELDGCIGFWANIYQWRVNLGEKTTEEAQKQLEPLKAARKTLARLRRKAAV